MTVTITQDITDISGLADNSVFYFYQTPDPRVGADGITMISTRRVVAIPSAGILTVDLDPGPCNVQIGTSFYHITIPDTNAMLWPLIEASLPIPAAQEASAVHNAGGVARIQRIAESAYTALAVKDPDTLYVVTEG